MLEILYIISVSPSQNPWFLEKVVDRRKRYSLLPKIPFWELEIMFWENRYLELL